MTFATELEREPWRFDLLATLRRIERSFPDRPRIGDAGARREEYVALGENPFLAFPPSNIEIADRDAQGRLRLLVKFLGLLGPQGPMPLATTEEAYGWTLAHEDAFPRFLDILNHRFLQLFFRAWADSRPIAQHDRPAEDRFKTYVGSAIGLGSPIFRDLDALSDDGKLAFAGLLAPAARSPSRLRGAIAGLFGVEVEIDEFVGTFLEFEREDQSRLGAARAGLGVDCLVGSSVFSVEDKIRLRIFTRDLAHYGLFLPGGRECEPLADLVFFYIGDELDWELELALPAREVQPIRLGQNARLGYTSWMVDAKDRSGAAGYRADARFHPADRLARDRARAG